MLSAYVDMVIAALKRLWPIVAIVIGLIVVAAGFLIL